MILRDLSFKTPQENVLFDEILLEASESDLNGENLRFWEAKQTFVVLGRVSCLEEDVNLSAVRKDNIPVLRRCSGGGTVLQGQGCLNYSLILDKAKHPPLAQIKDSYRYILSRIVDVLNREHVSAQFWPISDLALAPLEKKFSGNAQKRKRNYILHHGSFLYDFDLTLINKYLRMPRQQPEYRRNRTHLDFVTNVNLNKEKIKALVSQAFPFVSHVDHLFSHEENLLKVKLKQQKVKINI